MDIYEPLPWRTSRRKVVSSTPNGIQKHTTALLAPSSRCSRDIQCTWWPGCHMKCSSPWQEHLEVWLLVEHPRSYTDRILENCCWQLTLNLRASKLLQVITCCGPWTQTSRHILLCFWNDESHLKKLCRCHGRDRSKRHLNFRKQSLPFEDNWLTLLRIL